MTINELCKDANDASVKAGWQDEPRSFGDLIARDLADVLKPDGE
jgi:hypothetical protein